MPLNAEEDHIPNDLVKPQSQYGPDRHCLTYLDIKTILLHDHFYPSTISQTIYQSVLLRTGTSLTLSAGFCHSV